MLSRIKIEKLFRLYDYDIHLTNTDGSKIKFVTGPNGFGKTTILDFVNGVMKLQFGSLLQTPFDAFALYFNEEREDSVFRVNVKREEERTAAVDSDISETTTTLLVSLERLTDVHKQTIERFAVIRKTDGSVETQGNTGNTELFFAPRTNYYLTDHRIHQVKTDVVDETLTLDTFSLSQYAKEMKAILESPERNKEFEDRVNLFKRIIDRCEFANKHLEIDKRFGFRFVADDALETKLSLDQLSSGEKHMVVQMFELLFRAKEGTLVMIDEPELSLHMMWQMNYLKNMEEIVALRGFQCVIATHQPQIFNSLWTKSVDLYANSRQD